MAPATSSSANIDDDLVPIEQIIFSCSICQASPSEVYARVETSQGFHSRSGHDDGIVTKLWIASCSHITCSKHLKDGEIPFHSGNRTPQVVCPRCSKDHGDDTLKEVYAIHGLHKGEYDSIIPDEWLRSPPVKLDTSVPGMSAVRFQYVALSHFARYAKGHWTSTQRKLSAMDTALSQERKNSQQAQAHILELHSKIESLEKCEGRLKKWEARKAVIYHTLGQVNEMVNEIEMHRRQLRHLGYSTPTYRYSFAPRGEGDREGAQERVISHNNEKSRSLAPIPHPSTRSVEHKSSTPRKRKREQGEDTKFYEPLAGKQAEPRRSSCEMMPPPLHIPQPLPRQPNSPLHRSNDWHEASSPNHSAQLGARNAPAFGAPAVPTRCRPVQRPHQHTGQLHESHTRQLPRYAPSLPRPYIEDVSVLGSDSVAITSTERRPYQQGDAVQPFLRMAIDSPAVYGNPGYRQSDHSMLSKPARIVEQGVLNPRTHHFNAVYGSVANQAPSTLGGAGTTTRSGGAHGTPSPQKASQAPARLVTSPFFSGDATGTVTTHRPITRGHMARPPNPVKADYSVSGYSQALPDAAFRKPLFFPCVSNSRAFTNKDHSNPFQPSWPQEPQDSTVRPLRAQHSLVPSTPRDSRANLHQQREPHQLLRQSDFSVQAGSHHGRISQPPSSHKFGHLTASQHQAHYEILGVHDRISQIRMPYATAHSSMAGRNLFTAANARRSVRR